MTTHQACVPCTHTLLYTHRALQEVLAETGQEVPGWLGNIAQRHAPYGQKSRRGGGRFGGRDFRKDFGGHNNCE